MPIFHEHKLIFIHIPKNAGTSICKLFGLNNFDNQQVDLNSLFGQYQGTQLQHLKYNQLSQYLSPEIMSTYKYLAIIRSPIDRLVSEYQWLKSHHFWSQHLIKHLNSLREFLEYLEQLIDSGKIKNCFIHWHSQQSFIKGLDQTNPNVFIIRFEHLQEDLDRFLKSTKIKINVDSLQHLNQSVKNCNGIYGGDLELLNIVANKLENC